MKKIFLLTLFVIAIPSISFSSTEQAKKIELKNFPSSLPYTATISSDVKLKKRNKHVTQIRYFKKGSDKVLYREQHKNVILNKNKISLTLGTGKYKKSKLGSLQEVFANNTEVEMLIELDGQMLYPKIGILPAGHSQESAMILTQGNSNDKSQHWKGFKSKTSMSAFQAANLSTTNDSSSPSEKIRTNPYLLKMRGPVESVPLVTLTDAVQKNFRAKEANKPRHEDLYDSRGIRFGTGTLKVDDALAKQSQLSASTSGLSTPALSIGFQGMPNISGFLPPDTEGAVGVTYYVQQVNSTTQIFNKATGAPVSAAFNTNTLWTGFGGRCESDNSGDAIALYDEQAARWILTQFAVGGSPEQVCFAVSQTSNPLGSYYLYSLVTQRFPDYYKLGVWPAANNNAYFMGTNSGLGQ